jgi:hypothetical protein
MFENSLEKSPSRGAFKPSTYRRMPLPTQAKEGNRERSQVWLAAVSALKLRNGDDRSGVFGLCIAIFFPKA